jgi:hypothetical protein
LQEPVVSPADRIAQALLAPSSGDPSIARPELDRVLDQHSEALRNDNHLFASALYAALKEGNVDAATNLIGRRWDTETWFKIDFQDTGHLEVLRWQIGGRRQSNLSLHYHLRQSKTAQGYALRLTGMLSLLTAYCLDDACESGELFINIGDHAYIPGLAFSESRPNYFLVPDVVFLETGGYEKTRKKLAESHIAWGQRAPIAFWRGATTGYRSKPALGWRSLPRVCLCAIAQEHSDLIDAGISGVAQGVSEEEVRAAGFMRPIVPIEEFAKYKFQIDIDGNSNSWPGLFQKLLTGNPVLKVASPHGYRQWYYDKLKPWVNFVPVSSDMSDLVEKVVWLRSHDDAARRIGEEGKKLADALDLRGEISRSGRTITAALRYFVGKPEQSLRFGERQKDNQFLTQGWGNCLPDSVSAAGAVSSIVMPRPAARFDIDLGFEVSPFLPPPTAPAQELGIAVNGKFLVREEVAERKVVNCRVPAELLARFDDVSITLLHPCATTLASPNRPLDDQTVSIVLHALTLEAKRPRRLTLYSTSPQQVEATSPSYLLTHHGRLVGANDEGELVQLDPTEDARHRFVQIKNILEGEVIESGPLAGFKVWRGERGVRFEKNGQFLCAEPRGELIANRQVASLWETYLPVSDVPQR